MNSEEADRLREISDNNFLRSFESRARLIELQKIKEELHNELEEPLAILDRIAKG